MIRQARQIASVCMFRRKFGASSKPCSRIICSEYIPQPSTNSGASTARRVSEGCLPATASCRWWPGYASWMLVLLIELKLCSRIAVGLSLTDGVTM